ncbi:hypothetical protein ERICIV_02820 [Paenibacillus larvae subsp. larvae]|uniref:Uncharacterized protein n=1 Tax=Paenibacillus larvae subsp. larvae TaxID=147375 RepID=A0A2L1UFP4_9BACL|nr:hypothetical protein ERICIII_02829 [Paenibacillus larvae subsp. larvae]AVF31711.1 hypothetical protein ERICIV_02820 [Paenibacillus larvae subsp. larvae]
MTTFFQSVHLTGHSTVLPQRLFLFINLVVFICTYFLVKNPVSTCRLTFNFYSDIFSMVGETAIGGMENVIPIENTFN